MTKSKSSTIAIVVLSVLLAAALASTIVLAAFNFSQKASTTITFGDGLTLEVNGISDATVSSNLYAWNGTVNGGSENSTGTLSNITRSFTLDAISMYTETQGGAYVVARASIEKSGTGSAAAPAVQFQSGWVSIGDDEEGNEWYLYGSDASTPTALAGSSGSPINFVSQISVNTIDDTYVNVTFTAEFEVQAVNVSGYTSPAEALTALKAMAGFASE